MEQSSDSIAQRGQRGLDRIPDLIVVDHGVAMDQQVTKCDDIAEIWYAVRQRWIELRKPVQGLT